LTEDPTEESDPSHCYAVFCEGLDQIEDKQARIEAIDNAIHRLNFERRWQSLTPLQAEHMCDESLSRAEHDALAKAKAKGGKHYDELVTVYARSRYFRKCAWMCYLNGETDEPPLADSITSVEREPGTK